MPTFLPSCSRAILMKAPVVLRLQARIGIAQFDEFLAGASVVIAHEWTPPEIIADLSRRRRRGHFVLLFHDTHHRAVTSPHEIDDLDLAGFDGILAFGEVLRELYARRGWGRNAFTWHEAADVALFRPYRDSTPDDKGDDLIWIGNPSARRLRYRGRSLSRRHRAASGRSGGRRFRHDRAPSAS
jgi:spore maturation protein CgeB